MPEIRFISGNPHKISETQSILGPLGFTIVPVSLKINEIQTSDVTSLVKDKCVKAFREIGRPLFVEHTSLFLEALGGFPGGLTEVFWNTVEADRFSAMFGGTNVIAKTVIGYCDGKKMSQFPGEISGLVASSPAGSRDFQWDCVFIPDGYSQTFAELGDKKNEISMRRIAVDAFATYLRSI